MSKECTTNRRSRILCPCGRGIYAEIVLMLPISGGCTVDTITGRRLIAV